MWIFRYENCFIIRKCKDGYFYTDLRILSQKGVKNNILVVLWEEYGFRSCYQWVGQVENFLERFHIKGHKIQ